MLWAPVGPGGSARPAHRPARGGAQPTRAAPAWQRERRRLAPVESPAASRAAAAVSAMRHGPALGRPAVGEALGSTLERGQHWGRGLSQRLVCHMPRAVVCKVDLAVAACLPAFGHAALPGDDETGVRTSSSGFVRSSRAGPSAHCSKASSRCPRWASALRQATTLSALALSPGWMGGAIIRRPRGLWRCGFRCLRRALSKWQPHPASAPWLDAGQPLQRLMGREIYEVNLALDFRAQWRGNDLCAQ